MDDQIAEGTERTFDGRLRVFYDGYWIKAYPIPSDTLAEKRRLIEVLTRRLFNHVEHGLYVPGSRLEEARSAFDSENDVARKRLKGGMLAAALFNRAADILTKLVDLQSSGVVIAPGDPLLRRCGEHLQEALALGRMVLHRSGEEGIDELWGEPFKAFAFPIPEFYRSRYIKVAMAMRCIDRIVNEAVPALASLPGFRDAGRLFHELASAAKTYSETLRADPDIFDVWTSFAVARERLLAFPPDLGPKRTPHQRQQFELGKRLVRETTDLMSSIARARVPMPKSTDDLIARCKTLLPSTGSGAHHYRPEVSR
jgi:hypothetical protein